jgi:hypothetical protein
MILQTLGIHSDITRIIKIWMSHEESIRMET